MRLKINIGFLFYGFFFPNLIFFENESFGLKIKLKNEKSWKLENWERLNIEKKR